MSTPHTVAFHTLGCKVNYTDTSELARRFAAAGYRPVPFGEGADVYVINTCSVTENADRECRAVVQRALRENPSAFVAVTGCFAQLKPDAIAALEGVDLVAGAADKFSLAERIGRTLDKRDTQVFACDIATVSEFIPARSGSRTRTFLKVQDGCDYTCSFCTIPLARGRSRSDTIEHAVAQAREAVAEGAHEIVLTGVNLGDFRDDSTGHTRGFIDLVRALDGLDLDVRYRISSIEPNLLSDEIIGFVAGSEKFVPHFHIPLQSGSDRVLRRMRRRYLTGLYRDRIEKIKSRMPEAGIGADVITGFPGETEADFRQTVEFIESLAVSYLHVFTYSERANTDAASLPGSVPVPERKRRTAVLRSLSDIKRNRFALAFAGTPADVLFESPSDGVIGGYAGNYIRVEMPYAPGMENSVLRVCLESVGKDGVMHAASVHDPFVEAR